MSTTEVLLILGSQAVCWKNRKKLAPKKETKLGEEMITNGCINSSLAD